MCWTVSGQKAALTWQGNLNSGKNSSVGHLPPVTKPPFKKEGWSNPRGIWKCLNPWEILTSNKATGIDHSDADNFAVDVDVDVDVLPFLLMWQTAKA